jgi:hypothetical protein
MNKLLCAVSKVAVCHVTWFSTCTLALPHGRLIGKVVCVFVAVHTRVHESEGRAMHACVVTI